MSLEINRVIYVQLSAATADNGAVIIFNFAGTAELRQRVSFPKMLDGSGGRGKVRGTRYKTHVTASRYVTFRRGKLLTTNSATSLAERRSDNSSCNDNTLVPFHWLGKIAGPCNSARPSALTIVPAHGNTKIRFNRPVYLDFASAILPSASFRCRSQSRRGSL